MSQETPKALKFHWESPVPVLKSLKSPPFFPGKNTGHLRTRSHILLIIQGKTTKILSLFSRRKQNATRLRFSPEAYVVETSISLFTKILKLSSFIHSSSWDTIKQTLFQEGLQRIKVHWQKHRWVPLVGLSINTESHALLIPLRRWSSRLGWGSLASVLTSRANFSSLHMKGCGHGSVPTTHCSLFAPSLLLPLSVLSREFLGC